MNGCQYCRMDTAGNHEDHCPMKRSLDPGREVIAENFDASLCFDGPTMIELLKDIKRLLESIDKKVGFIRQKYASNR